MTEDKEWFSKIDNQKLMNILIQELETNCDTFYKPTEEDLLRRKKLLQEMKIIGMLKNAQIFLLSNVKNEFYLLDH